jgi:dTDP-4-dehydrorhamnose 3,5-epimerase
MKPILIDKIQSFEDRRGLFYESFKTSVFKDVYGIEEVFVQDNHSVSCKNTIRGMHYQWDKPMGKLVRVATGAITDVIVDIRRDSDSFGDVYRYELDDENLHQLYVPPGYAHGFICRSETAVVMYKCTSEYNKNGESGINPFDPFLNIDWGIDYNEAVVSQKDLDSKNLVDYLKEPKF